MESASSAPQGYSAEFEAILEERYKCPICVKALKEPLQTPCGHRFCEKCLEPITRNVNPTCPIDGEQLELTELFRDVCCKREILQLVCFCKNKKFGCEWKGELRHLEDHEGGCNHREVPCPNPGCKELVPSIRLEEHMQENCQFKVKPCQYCRQEVTALETENHQETCSKFPVPCVAGCGTTDIPRDEMDYHLTNTCLQAVLPCPYSRIGCQFTGSRDELKEHMDNPTQSEHLKLVHKNSKEIENKTAEMSQKLQTLTADKRDLEERLANQNETLATAVQDVRAYQHRLGKVERTITEHRREITQIRQRMEMVTTAAATSDQLIRQFEEVRATMRDHDNKMAFIEREITRLGTGTGTQVGPRSLGQPNLLSCERRLDRNEHQLALHDIQLAEHDLKVQMLEATSYDGMYLWKIDEWARRFQESASNKTPSIYSPPFYIGRFGYKVCARVYPNGDGMGENSHLSLFFVIVKGEYDALLPWPFKQKVTFRLLDQDRQQDVTDTFRSDPNSSSFKKPTTNMNIASGCPLFVSHTDLQQRAYIREDTIFIKITVDMSGLPAV